MSTATRSRIISYVLLAYILCLGAVVTRSVYYAYIKSLPQTNSNIPAIALDELRIVEKKLSTRIVLDAAPSIATVSAFGKNEPFSK